jgi:hypothetical protein
MNFCRQGCGGCTGLADFSTHRRDFAADSLQMQQWAIADATIDCG